MSPDRGTRRALVAAVALLLTGSVAAPARAAAPPGCEVVLVSPAYRRDRTLVCVHRPYSVSARILAVSRDAGRTGPAAARRGLARPDGPAGVNLTAVLSPTFGEDATVFAATESGTFVSGDAGETFTALDPLAPGGGSDDNPVAFLGVSPLGGGTGLQLAYGSARGAAIVDVASRLHPPALGVPGLGARRFLVPTGEGAPAGALALVNAVAADGREALMVARCDAVLTCAEPLFTFPPGVMLGASGWVRALPDGSIVASLGDGGTWRSTDGGRTFAIWTSVAKLVAASDAAGGYTAFVAVAASAAFPRRLYLRIEKSRPPAGWPRTAPPASRVLRSDDGGATWRLVAFGRAWGQPGARGRVPWIHAGRGGPHLQLTPDGRLLASGGNEDAVTTFCSVDGGVRWTTGCPR